MQRGLRWHPIAACSRYGLVAFTRSAAGVAAPRSRVWQMPEPKRTPPDDYPDCGSTLAVASAVRCTIRGGSYRGPMAKTRLYRDGELALEDFPVSDISEYLKEGGAYVWLDYCS